MPSSSSKDKDKDKDKDANKTKKVLFPRKFSKLNE
jgi:hypothetical protein